MHRWRVYWKGQNLEATPAGKLCAGHSEAACEPLCVPEVKKFWEDEHELITEVVEDGECLLASYGGCCDDPVTVIPKINVEPS